MKDFIVILLLAFGVISIYAEDYPPPKPDPNADFPVDTFGCGVPDCHTSHGYHILWPHQDPKHFYQCEPMYHPTLQTCGPGTLFGYYHQVCVHEWLWNPERDHCDNSTTITSPPIGDPDNSNVTDTLWMPPLILECIFDYEEPDCNGTIAQDKLWPHKNSGKYYQCSDCGPVVHICSTGYLFSYSKQECVTACIWKEEYGHCSTEHCYS